MLTAAQCRENAAECANLARDAHARKQRDILFDMARTWETMAKQAERLDRQKQSDTAFIHETS